MLRQPKIVAMAISGRHFTSQPIRQRAGFPQRRHGQVVGVEFGVVYTRVANNRSSRLHSESGTGQAWNSLESQPRS